MHQSYFRKYLIYSILQLHQNIAVKVRKIIQPLYEDTKKGDPAGISLNLCIFILRVFDIVFAQLFWVPFSRPSPEADARVAAMNSITSLYLAS